MEKTIISINHGHNCGNLTYALVKNSHRSSRKYPETGVLHWHLSFNTDVATRDVTGIPFCRDLRGFKGKTIGKPENPRKMVLEPGNMWI